MYGFQRDISFKYDKTENGDIKVINTLRDKYHDINLEVIIDFATLRIKDIDAQFIKTPTLGCPRIKAKLDLLIGLFIGKGMTRKIMEVLGGSEGCGNIRNMLLSSLPVVLNIKYSAGIENEQEMLKSMYENLIGTCIGQTKM